MLLSLEGIAMSILNAFNASAVVDLYIEWSAIGMEYRNRSSGWIVGMTGVTSFGCCKFIPSSSTRNK
jgi:hypothetical protein